MEQNQPTSPKGEQGKDTDNIISPYTISVDVKSALMGFSDKDKHLKVVLESEQRLKQLKSADIVFSKPVLLHNDKPILFPRTINVIQGQAGVHKSRLAEYMCSAFLKNGHTDSRLLGFRKADDAKQYCVVYVDTERNQSEQLPFALQSIQLKAGFRKDEHPKNFRYISLLEIPRQERFPALELYLEQLRNEISDPLFVVLDVITDCIEDFNKTDKSMQLIDMMNVAINSYDVVFLCLIHENPNSEKARGHIGTELMNKASTVIQVSFERDGNRNFTDLIKAKFLKCRSTERHSPFNFKYCQIEKGLIIASESDIQSVLQSRTKKGDIGEIAEYLEGVLGDMNKTPKSEVFEGIKMNFSLSTRTLDERIKEIFETGQFLFNDEGVKCTLQKEQQGKVIYYFLKQVQTN